MCNLYAILAAREAMKRAFARYHDPGINFPRMPAVFPDYTAPIIRNRDGITELVTARWGMPSSKHALFKAATTRADKARAKGKTVDFAEMLRLEPDGGTTNVRNTNSKHWRPWLGPANRCLVPFNSFSEPETLPDGKKTTAWFALDDTRPLAFFAGIWCNHTSVRKVKEGEVNADLYAFLTTDANAEVYPIHPKAMPVILTKPEELETWMTAPVEEALKLQRPLPNGMLKVVARGEKQDDFENAAATLL